VIHQTDKVCNIAFGGAFPDKNIQPAPEFFFRFGRQGAFVIALHTSQDICVQVISRKQGCVTVAECTQPEFFTDSGIGS